MIKTAVARRYAQALFELLDTSTIESARTALTGLGQAIKDSAELRHVVASPAIGPEAKISVLAELSSRLGCPPIIRTFLSQLMKKNRIGFLPEIAEAFAKFADASKGVQQITVSSASALTTAEQDRIRTRLGDMLKRRIEVNFETDARHLAGVQIHLGSTVVDSTVRGRLQAMEALLKKE